MAKHIKPFLKKHYREITSVPRLINLHVLPKSMLEILLSIILLQFHNQLRFKTILEYFTNYILRNKLSVQIIP